MYAQRSIYTDHGPIARAPNGSDPRDGQIADDPSDVVVRINGSVVPVVEVHGLLGQVVLQSVPNPTDTIEIDYYWIENPTVEVRRLNDVQFRLNSWNRDVGIPTESGHIYRYNNVLVTPSAYSDTDIQAKLDQPYKRDLHYRAYERAYTASLNDPTTLTLNAPIHRIAYPQMSRTVDTTFVRYAANVLPEQDRWLRVGTGTASVSAGVLRVQDDSTGDFPTGQPIYWTRPIDLSFPAAFATSWRGYAKTTTTPEGVFSGVAAGYSTTQKLVMVGYLVVGGLPKLGLLVGPTPSKASSWVYVDVDWTTLHSYRTYQDVDGNVSVYVDGNPVASLQASADTLPYLKDLDVPFDQLQQVFFGAPSRPAKSESYWDFMQYYILPTSPTQVAPTSFCSYEGNVIPEDAAKPWTPIGSHGSGEILSNGDYLLNDTSGSSHVTGLVTGDYRGYLRMEPLLPAASDVLLDAQVQINHQTNGLDPQSTILAVDDGKRLLQLCFLADRKVPTIPYGGRSLPSDWGYTSLGGAQATMLCQKLVITDTSTTDGLVFYIDDTHAIGSDTRVIDPNGSWSVEANIQVVSYTAGSGPDPKPIGATFQVYDSSRLVGLQLTESGGVPGVTFHSDGVAIATVPFDWSDGLDHTYRLVKNHAANLVSLFIDGVLTSTQVYSSFVVQAPASNIGTVTFGSVTPLDTSNTSVIQWSYLNVWKTVQLRTYVGLWKGSSESSLTSYITPVKAKGKAATVAGNGLSDPNASFLSSGVVAGDLLVIDSGDNKGTYEIASVASETNLTTVAPFPVATQTTYRIPLETSLSVSHRYRLVRSPEGDVSVLLDSETSPIITTTYDALPFRQSGVLHTLSSGQPCVAWGSFSQESLSQSRWAHVRYGISRSPTELRIAPHHQVLNQWNVIASPEHLDTSIVHTHTGYHSCSTGIPPHMEPDLFDDPALQAYTQLNDGTPLIPLTRTWAARKPRPIQIPLAGLNRIEDVLTTDPDFVLNDARVRVELDIPDDVLYRSLQVTTQTEGVKDLLKPFKAVLTAVTDLTYTKDVCLHYDGAVLPEHTEGSTPWQIQSDDPMQVSTSAVNGVLTYGTGALGTRTVYKNSTPLPDSLGMDVTASYRIKIAQDTTNGLGDTLQRVGLSGPFYTIALAFMTTPVGERIVLAYDMTDNKVLGSVLFDYLDGLMHTYTIRYRAKSKTIQIEVV